MKEFVKIREEAREEAEKTGQPFDETETPKMSYYKARQVSLHSGVMQTLGRHLTCVCSRSQVMTRGDFMPQLDHINVGLFSLGLIGNLKLRPSIHYH
jgi:hypothetical protein